MGNRTKYAARIRIRPRRHQESHRVTPNPFPQEVLILLTKQMVTTQTHAVPDGKQMEGEMREPKQRTEHSSTRARIFLLIAIAVVFAAIYGGVK